MDLEAIKKKALDLDLNIFGGSGYMLENKKFKKVSYLGLDLLKVKDKYNLSIFLNELLHFGAGVTINKNKMLFNLGVFFNDLKGIEKKNFFFKPFVGVGFRF